MSSTNIPCIYCKSTTSKKTKEHVIPSMLGLFENTMTLVDLVCGDCNQFFSKKIELHFGRDSIFGIFYRGYVGLLNDTDFSRSIKHSRKRLETILYHSTYAFLHVNINLHDTSAFQAQIADQFSILNSTKGNRINYRAEKLPHRSYLDSIGLPVHRDRFLFLGSIEEDNKKTIKLNRILQQNDITLTLGQTKHQPDKLPSDGPLQFASVIDDAIIRTVAKIAFNYLAYFFEPSFILDEQFDEIRNYVLYGRKTIHDLVIMEYREIREHLQNLQKEMFGHHRISLHQDRNTIIATITLFNRTEFKVILTNCDKLYRPDINKSNTFNILDKKTTGSSLAKKRPHIYFSD